jgi:hypothetical protein
MENKHSDNRSLHELETELSQVRLKQLDSRIHKVKKYIKIEKKKLDRLTSQLLMTKQHIEFYTQEYQRALEGIKDSNWKITKEICNELRKISNPSSVVIEICEKVMLILEQSDKSFEGFRALSKNFGLLKDLMGSVQNHPLSDSVINEILPIWKAQATIKAKLSKTSKCTCLLAEWIGYIVEYSLKKETVNSSKRREPELEKKIKNQNLVINDLNNEMAQIQDNALIIRRMIECKVEIEDQEISENFHITPEGGCKPLGFTMHKGTASGGILLKSFDSQKSQTFPNFNDKELYSGIKVNLKDTILYEGNTETIGCCRMKFFCF